MEKKRKKENKVMMERNEFDNEGHFWYERAHFVLPAKWSTLIEVMRDKGLGRKNQDILLRMHYGPERKKKHLTHIN